jgi:predicted nucleic acid-binding protein
VTVVVDTNVVAYLLLGTEPYATEVRSFWTALGEAQAPALWEAELTNALRMATRHRVVTAEEATKRLILAEGLGIRSVPVRSLWQGALVRASRSGCSAYDMLFVELAVRERRRLATFDGALLRAFPEVAARPAELL